MPRWSRDPAAPRRRRSRHWPDWASPTSPLSHATRTRPPGWSSWLTGSAQWPGSATSTTARSAESFAGVPVLLDAIYDPWPTPLASAVAAGGGRVISGLQMLLYQAFAQVEQFTGLPAPRAAMAAALD